MTCVAVLVASLTVVFAIASRFAPAGAYGVFGHPVMSVLSGSMSPTIKTGDLVIDQPLAASEASHLHVGQIISFRAGDGAIFTHRIHAVIRVNGSVAYQTKGDANNAPDTVAVFPSQVVGLYSHSIPYGGYILSGLHKPTTLILLLMAPLLWLLSSWLYAKAREADRPAPALHPGGKEVALM
jgi:signal peptidase